jgi:5-methylcytosine-specific restriction endonuclease McrA
MKHKKQKPDLATLRDRAFDRQRGLCHWCGEPMIYRARGAVPKPWGHPMTCTADHIIRVADGGKTVFSNIVAACQKCNSGRHSKKIIHTHHKEKRHE